MQTVDILALKQHFSLSTLRQGLVLADKQRVSKMIVTGAGIDFDEMECDVADDSGKRFNVYSLHDFSSDPHGFKIFESGCTCGAIEPCAHTAAGVIAMLREQYQEVRMDAKALALEGSHASSSATSSEIVDIKDWFNQISELSHTAKKSSNQVLHYQLHIAGYNPIIEVVKVNQLKSGKLSGFKPYNPTAFLNNPRTQFIHPADVPVLFILAKLVRPHAYGARTEAEGGTMVPSAVGFELLQAAVKTGRLFYGDSPVPLSWGEPEAATAQWQALDNGVQKPTFKFANDALRLVTTHPVTYFNPQQHCLGEVQTNLPAAYSSKWLELPPLSLEGQKAWVLESQMKCSEAPLPQPVEIEKVALDVDPVPVINLFAKTLEPRTYFPASYERDDTIYGFDLNFRYGETLIEWHDDNQAFSYIHENKLLTIKRKKKQEKAVIKQLQKLGFRELVPEEHPSYFHYNWVDFEDVWTIADSDWLTWCKLITTTFKDLDRAGWTIEIDPSFDFKLIEDDDWYADLEPSDNNWFEFDAGIEIKGRKISLLSTLANFIQRYKITSVDKLREAFPEGLIPVSDQDDNTVLLPLKLVENVCATLFELYDPKINLVKKKLKINPWRAAELAIANELTVERKHAAIAQNIDMLNAMTKQHSAKTVKLPKQFKGTLRDYQQEGVTWLNYMRDVGAGAILADDMGLGKTIQTLALLVKAKASRTLQNPALIIAPTSLMYNWAEETKRFAPTLKSLVIHGSERHAHFEALHKYDAIFTTYPLIVRDFAHYRESKFSCIILDEAQTIKNPKAQMTQCICALDGEHRICLTGTPLENHLGELWSLFNFLMPGFLAEQTSFNRNFRKAIENNNEERLELLNRRVAPFMLRRKKEQVAQELPAKTEMMRMLPLSPKQTELYETVRLAMQQKVRESIEQKGVTRSHIIILDALLKLRQICCDPRLLKKTDTSLNTSHSTKLEAVIKDLQEMLEEGRRVILFSQFTQMLKILQQELTKQKINYALLTGVTRNRQAQVDLFQKREVPLFLISLKAGGTGLNLTAADTVIHYDPWWNPAVENQATDRAHRIGQDKPVFVYRYITEGTVEEKIVTLQKNKSDLAESILGGKAKAKFGISESELNHLFAPARAR